MTAAAEGWPEAEAAPGSMDALAESAQRTITSIPDLIAELAGDALELLALESRAAALTLAVLVFACVAGACFALFAWFGLSAIGVVVLVRWGLELPWALAVLAALNAALAVGSGLVVRRVTRSVLFERSRQAHRKPVRKEGDSHVPA